MPLFIVVIMPDGFADTVEEPRAGRYSQVDPNSLRCQRMNLFRFLMQLKDHHALKTEHSLIFSENKSDILATH
jgi:hypothetical protein